MDKKYTSIKILLAEDNPGDARLTEKAFEKAKLANKFYVVKNGKEALKFLRQEGEYANKPRPDLILLDIQMPEKNGIDVLKEIKQDPELKHIPAIILTSSKEEEDILKSYKSYANAYLTKPIDFKGFREMVKKFDNFWFKIVKLPTKKGS